MTDKRLAYLVEELTTGLVDGYWYSFKGANNTREYFQKEFPDLQFVVKNVIVDHELHESEMIIYSEWAHKERLKK
jgi:hypothetical protein